jgi:hypothetical protein
MQEANNTVWVASSGFATVLAATIGTKRSGETERQRIESENRMASSSGFGSCFVACYNALDGRYLKKYNNSFSAGKSMGLSIEKIDIALKSKLKVYAGIKWCYIDRSNAPSVLRKREKNTYIHIEAAALDMAYGNSLIDQVEHSEIISNAGWCFSIEDDPFRLIGQHVLR